MDYLFTYAVKKARKTGFESLAEHERWDWHADVYGFRRVVLGASPDEHTSPCDPDGQWFDPARAKLAEQHYRGKARGPTKRTQQSDSDIMFEARDVENKWAQQRGYADLENYKDSERIDHVEACARVIKSFLAAMPVMPGKNDDKFATARDLGVIAREEAAE